MEEEKRSGYLTSSVDGSKAFEKEAVYEGDVPEAVVTKDGIPLHPQPTNDPLDPLNWNEWRKHTMLVIVMWM